MAASPACTAGAERVATGDAGKAATGAKTSAPTRGPVRGTQGGPLAFVAHIPFVEEIGLQLWAAGGGRSELRLPLDGGHLNHRLVAHGGVLMTLLDVAMAQAARTLHVAGEPLGPAVITIEMKTTFVQPATPEAGVLKATGHVLHRTRSMAFCEGHVLDGAGALCVHASGTFKYVRPLPGQHASGGDG